MEGPSNKGLGVFGPSQDGPVFQEKQINPGPQIVGWGSGPRDSVTEAHKKHQSLEPDREGLKPDAVDQVRHFRREASSPSRAPKKNEECGSRGEFLQLQSKSRVGEGCSALAEGDPSSSNQAFFKKGLEFETPALGRRFREGRGSLIDKDESQSISSSARSLEWRFWDAVLVNSEMEQYTPLVFTEMAARLSTEKQDYGGKASLEKTLLPVVGNSGKIGLELSSSDSVQDPVVGVDPTLGSVDKIPSILKGDPTLAAGGVQDADRGEDEGRIVGGATGVSGSLPLSQPELGMNLEREVWPFILPLEVQGCEPLNFQVSSSELENSGLIPREANLEQGKNKVMLPMMSSEEVSEWVGNQLTGVGESLGLSLKGREPEVRTLNQRIEEELSGGRGRSKEKSKDPSASNSPCAGAAIAAAAEPSLPIVGCFNPTSAQHKEGRPLTRTGIEPENVVLSVGLKSSDSIRRGSAGVVGSMMLLNSHQKVHAPFTQDAPLMTEDMHEERLRAVEALGNSFELVKMEKLEFSAVPNGFEQERDEDASLSAQLERDTLSSDMSAFKAANPDAVFEDFIRWHSPGDWENDATEGSGRSRSHATEGLRDDWPPRGRLSQRMSENGNSWWRIWNNAPALPASEQKPLLDPNREGEKILHYLETVRPNQLLEQMVCTAFGASADSLNQTSFGGLQQMMTEIEQLYLTMASALKPLQSNPLPDKGEIVDDIRRLCVVFANVEKLLILAASIHRKLSQAPRLSEAIFGDCNFYLLRMGTGMGSNGQMEFDLKQQVRMYERQVVTNLFVPPTANQSWRKVLSMGNLLNGHEPILREIIFSVRDSMNGSHYRDHSPRSPSQEIETHRMYICGTSNDLRVALSVTSCD
ncbi:hypothetical protein HHK36_032380 [Tetracentron sinense]|uniref:Rab3 GTPase-activating protein catalytic subunit n=1 Tax=Tetracentron sinense TaxID=13715 RepID=A0A834YAV3_TETSI|nr:hypothetical protein HHK36_032380 [Tetracentron sinense]